MINIHDIAWGEGGLWVTNSAFSCLATLDSNHSFVPRWKPPFITDLAPEDRCHLNGMAMRDGKPRYVSMFNQSNSAQHWRADRTEAGVIMDIQTNRVLVENLALPHSPRWYRGQLFFCHSGYGSVCRYDPASSTTEEIIRLPGFTRGLAFCGPLMFVGLSRVRYSKAQAPVWIADNSTETRSGVWVVNLDTRKTVAYCTFDGDVSQIYDVALLMGPRFPELVEWDSEAVRKIFMMPAQQVLSVPESSESQKIAV
jgi:uncharacterized protein (TIGR03032 family)